MSMPNLETAGEGRRERDGRVLLYKVLAEFAQSCIDNSGVLVGSMVLHYDFVYILSTDVAKGHLK